MFKRRVLDQTDFLLPAAAVLLTLIGLMGIYSAGTGNVSGIFFSRQLLWLSVGIAVCLVAATIDYRRLIDHAFLFYGLSVTALVVVLLYGTEINGNKSWIHIGNLGFQPSEMVKIVVILTLTRYVSELTHSFLRYRDMFVLAGITLLPFGLVVLQGDLGTALTFIPIGLGIMLVAGVRLRFLLILTLVSICVAPAGWFLLKDYQKQRILVTFDPELDPQGYGYQVRQSRIAIGSGGFVGKGPGQGLQSQLGFIPEVHTDFIFSLLAEETGFVGAATILLLYLFVLFRLLFIAEQARDRAGILIATGIATLLFVHLVINVGMTIGILPAIGIPLPLLSYGGSSLLSTFMAIGLAMNIYSRRFVHN